MHYYLYEIKNKINSKIYIGVHKTENINDGYMGSGVAICFAIDKYGIDSFEKRIIQFFDNAEDMYSAEASIVNEEFLCREDVYNLREGGQGGWDYVHKNGMHKSLQNYTEEKRSEINEKIRTSKLENPYVMPEEQRKALSERMKTDNPAKKDSVKYKLKESLTGLLKTEEHKRNISKSMKSIVREKGYKLKPGRKYNVPRVAADLTCPHCGKTGSAFGMPRWHFDNCKMKAT